MIYNFYGIPIQYRIERRNGGEDFVLVLLLRGTYNKAKNRYELSAGKHGRVMFELSPRKLMTKKELSLRERIEELMPVFWEGALNKMGKKPFTKLSYRERRLQMPNLPLAAIYSADMGEMLRGSKQVGASPSHDTMKMYDRALQKLLPEFGARTFATLLPRGA